MTQPAASGPQGSCSISACTNAALLVSQDEFKFFMEDAKSKLLLVPSEGNSTAEKAASDLHVPIAALKITSSGGELSMQLLAILLQKSCYSEASYAL